MRNWTKSQKLQFAAFMVAGARFLGMGAMALGVDLVREYSLFFWLEVFSWLGFAILEGYAVPYISRGARLFEQGEPERRMLMVYRIILLLAIPALGAPYYIAVSQQLNLIDVMWYPLYWVWAFLFAGIGAIIIDAVGTVEMKNEPPELRNEPELEADAARDVTNEAWGIVTQRYYLDGTLVSPPELVEMVDNQIDEAQAVGLLNEWYSTINKRPGAKSAETKQFELAVNYQNGKG
ncbi:MAG: hypothetical protein AAF485_05735 [Chloroflexota bacterium]